MVFQRLALCGERYEQWWHNNSNYRTRKMKYNIIWWYDPFILIYFCWFVYVVKTMMIFVSLSASSRICFWTNWERQIYKSRHIYGGNQIIIGWLRQLFYWPIWIYILKITNSKYCHCNTNTYRREYKAYCDSHRFCHHGV